ncbi:anion transporter [candidate division KSB1 bacterium]|nr:anion transporter [candidate division KSB1 bacterium]
MVSYVSSIIIISVTIIGVSLGRYPFLRMNRATIAFVGAVILVGTGAITTDQAFQAIDLNTIVLLLSIMILNVNFRLSGFFFIISKAILKLASTPKRLLAWIIIFSGLTSALFLNDTIVLVFTPIVIDMTNMLKRNPIPYLIALATSANIGSAATIIGNPQNILIGAFSGIGFIEFFLYLIPVAIIGLVVIWLIIFVLYKSEFVNIKFDRVRPPKHRVYRPLLRKSSISAALMLIALVCGVPTSVAAMIAAALLLITRRLKAERVFAEIDWSLLVFFSSLFVVTKSIDTIGLSDHLIEVLKVSTDNEVLDLTIIATISSNIVSNVPAVLLLKNIVLTYSHTKIAWLTLAMATTFAGNLTLLGSVANLIVAEGAKKRKVILSFNEYLRAGLPITLLTLLFGVLWFCLLLARL